MGIAGKAVATLIALAAVGVTLVSTSAAGGTPAGPAGWLFSCSGETGYPRSIFNEAPGAQFRDTPQAHALRKLLRKPGGIEFLPRRGWHEANVDEDGATFVAGRPTGPKRVFEVNFDRRRDGSFRYGSSSHYCSPGADPPGNNLSSEWRLDPAFPRPQPGDTVIHALVEGSFCNSGAPFGDRIEEPMLHMGRARIVIASTESPPPRGLHTCEISEPEVFTFRLGEALGTRPVLDGSVLPFRQRLAAPGPRG